MQLKNLLLTDGISSDCTAQLLRLGLFGFLLTASLENTPRKTFPLEVGGSLRYVSGYADVIFAKEVKVRHAFMTYCEFVSERASASCL